VSIATASAVSSIAPSLRGLYFVRFAFALAWSGLLFTTASSVNPVSVTLLVLYPAFDVTAAVIDARSSRNTKSAWGLYVNVVISLVAAAALAVAAPAGIPGILRVWGAWAIASGIVQLVVGASRRALSGQWPMMLSGAISTVAGTTFILQAAQDDAGLSTLAGYATIGGIFFLVSALRLGHTAKNPDA
jgi:hypothetical protein